VVDIKKIKIFIISLLFVQLIPIEIIEKDFSVKAEVESDVPLPKVDVWNQFFEVSKSETHTLAINVNGGLYVWGTNNFGQLGDGTTTNSLTPKLLTTINNVTKVSAGNGYSLAMTDDGKVWSWGNNDSSQLGRIATTGSPSALIPGELPIVLGATVIEANAFAIPTLAHSAFIKNGEVYTVGNGESGKLGNGSTANKSTISITDIKSKTYVDATSGNILDIKLGSNFTNILNVDTRPWGLGSNDMYQLTIQDVVVGRDKGQDVYGQVLSSLVPVRVTNGTGNITSSNKIYAGGRHSIQLGGASGTVSSMWGNSDEGQSGGDFTTKKTTRTSSNVASAINAGNQNSYVLENTKKVIAWGKNDKGQLGGNWATSRATASYVSTSVGIALENIKKIDNSIAISESNNIWSWGTYPGNGTNMEFYAKPISPVVKELGMIVEQGNLVNDQREIKITLKNSYSAQKVKISQDSHLKSFFRVVENGRTLGIPVFMGNGDVVYNTTISTVGVHTIYSIDSSNVEQRQEINVNLGPISKPTILSPVNSSYFTGDSIDLSWGGSSSPTGGIIEYELSLSKDNGVTWEIIKNFSSQTTGSYITTPSDLTNEAKFRVRAKNNNGDTSNYLVGNIFEIIKAPLFETFGNIDLGVANPDNSKIINAISTESNMLKFTQYTTTPHGYTINMTFSPFSSSTGNTISSSNLKIKKMILQTDTVEETSGEFGFQDNIPKQIMNIDSINANKTISYKISPSDIELTIPNDFVPSSNSPEEFTSTITYSAIIIP
jgi:alpha-tubulin suppressor-like RCC1 family protein